MMTTPTHSASQGSVLGPSIRFKGELHADEDLEIHGHVEGAITNSKYLTVGREGRVKAHIKGHIVAVEGTVEGDVTAETSVAVTATGQLKGDIRAPSVSIVDGADFNGSVLMSTNKAGRSSRPTEQPVAKATVAER
jgi:cytoskeletal protein CcmA (bactofilin family)